MATGMQETWTKERERVGSREWLPAHQPLAPSTLRQPLRQLHTGIRRYVVIEAVAILILGVAAWSLFSLILDWGLFFQLFHFDYLTDASNSVKEVVRDGLFIVLVALAGWVLVRSLFLRIIRPLPDWELALLLERRYGRELGDRLVTAVQMNDPAGIAKQGYSWEMVEAATQEAEKSLQNLAVSDTLNSKRLTKRIMLALGCLLVALAAFLFLPEVTATWAERNLLFQGTPWPRPILIEIANFPERNKAIPFGSELAVSIHTPKWGLADHTVPQGWRALKWSDLQSPSAWELEGFAPNQNLLEVLPDSWKQSTLDQVETRVREGSENLRRELGLELIKKCLTHFQAHEKDQASLPAGLGQFLPETLRQMTSGDQKVVLNASGSLTPKDVQRIITGLTTLRPVPEDAALWFVTLSTHPTVNPIPCFSALQKVAYDRDRDLPVFAIPENERKLLPPTWLKKLAIRDLAKRLRTFAAEETPDAIGESIVKSLQELFAQLDERAARTRFATRKTFRQFIVPERVTLEFENISEAETSRISLTGAGAKRGQPELKRLPLTNEYQYEFKKVERPMRFRAFASSVTTPWLRVDVKPLPTLQKLVCWHDEPAYLHNSFSRVQVGPIVLPLDGEEIKTEAPQGSTVWFVGESHKPLRAVRVITDNPAEAPGVEHQAGGKEFTIRWKTPPKEAPDLRMRLEFEDQDGIQAVRRLLVMFAPDKAPEFVKAQFDGVNRKFITPQAILPLSVLVKDDVGLLSLEYEVSVQKKDNAPVHEVRLPFRLFSPLRVATPGAVGLQTDQPEDMTLSTMGFLTRLTSPSLGLVPSFHAALRREFAHDYIDRNLHGPVISVDDEFLDTRLLRSALGKPEDKALLGTPYRMVVRLVARDNRMHEENNNVTAAHQEGKTTEAFEFTVVGEQDVIIEAGRREEDLRDRFEEIIATLTKLRNSLKRIRDDLDVPSQAKEEDVRRAASDAADATKTLATIRNGLDEKVLREYRQVFRELALNRVDSRILDRVDGRICRPLAFLLQPGGLFAKLEDTVDTLSRRLDAESIATPKSVLVEPVDQCTQVLTELDKILQDMKKLIEFNEALRVLRDLINNEQKLMDEVKELIKKKLENNLDDK
jgi:hypothetical protein